MLSIGNEPVNDPTQSPSSNIIEMYHTIMNPNVRFNMDLNISFENLTQNVFYTVQRELGVLTVEKNNFVNMYRL